MTVTRWFVLNTESDEMVDGPFQNQKQAWAEICNHRPLGAFYITKREMEDPMPSLGSYWNKEPNDPEI